MKRDDAEEYTQALGQVVAGGWRQIALGQRLGVPKALGLTVQEWVENRLGGYVKLSTEERRAALAELKAETENLTQEKAAQIFGVSQKTISDDLAASSKTTKPTVELPNVNPPDLSSSTKPLDLIAALGADESLRDEADRLATKSERDAKRDQLQKERVAPPLPLGIYRLLYADPPWRYEHVKTESRAVENQYPTMDLEAICALKVPAAPDAVLFLWATSPKLTEALHVLDAWGFTYRTCAVWDKEQIGMGYYFRQQHELLLVGGRGDAPVPEASTRLPSVFRSKRSEHSEKPTFVYGYLEAMYPTFTEADRVELFSREARSGWTQWSNEPEFM